MNNENSQLDEFDEWEILNNAPRLFNTPADIEKFIIETNLDVPVLMNFKIPSSKEFNQMKLIEYSTESYDDYVFLEVTIIKYRESDNTFWKADYNRSSLCSTDRKLKLPKSYNNKRVEPRTKFVIEYIDV